jgi:hypothetical protein
MELHPKPNSPNFGTRRDLPAEDSRGEAMSRGNTERGAGSLKAIIVTLILASIVYVAVKVLPILVNEYQFKDGIQNIARFASVNRQTVEQIRQAVLKEAERDNLPVQPEDVKVEAASGKVHISADISITVDLSVYQWTLNLHPEAGNQDLI